jgi:hypothetical protein
VHQDQSGNLLVDHPSEPSQEINASEQQIN